ncbi:MAG: hypothetical protein JXB46_11005 [Candidatus Eisenbacteria bacterium]|nr:hypothetical protein [Candidatus Eisenbacteria bacterium]
MCRGAVLAALLSVLLLTPCVAAGYGESFTRLVDLQTAHTLPRAAYALGVRVGPDGSLTTVMAVGVASYLNVGVSYGAGNAIGSGEVDWDNEVEFEFKLRLAEEFDVVPGLAVGYDSRGYGTQIGDGGYAKASEGIYVAAVKTSPFSDYWQFHGGVSRTLELERAEPDFFLGVTGRFSQEFSLVVEYSLGEERDTEGGSDKTGFLNAGLRWVFSEQLELALLLRNIVGPSGSTERHSRALTLAYYDSF